MHGKNILKGNPCGSYSSLRKYLYDACEKGKVQNDKRPG
jgi:hypothetical protein